MQKAYDPVDSTGCALGPGDVVRIIGTPDPEELAAESRPVFDYLVGRYKRIRGFDEIGLAEFFFRIPSGPDAGYHAVWLEPRLLRKRRRRVG